MKYYINILFSFFGILLTLNGCSENSIGGGDAGENQSTLEKMGEVLNLQQEAGIIYRDALQQSDDSLAALEAMGLWIGNNPAVDEAYYNDLESIQIHFKNGLNSSILIVPVDENGLHLTRGGGVATGLKNFVPMTNTVDSKTEEIKNDKVLIMMPYPYEFRYSYTDGRPRMELERLFDILRSAPEPLEIDFKSGSDVNMDVVNNMDDFGLIILDTHGLKHGFMIGSYRNVFKDSKGEWTPDKVKQEFIDQLKIPAAKIANGEIEMAMQIERNEKKKEVSLVMSAIVTENYIRNMDVDLSDVVVFGNHCYSGHTADGPNQNNMPQAWQSRGVSSYYGYAYEDGHSVPVENKFAIGMEQALLTRLVADTDTTGVSHLKEDGSKYFWDSRRFVFRGPKLATLNALPAEAKQPAPFKPFYFNHFFETNYTYEKCEETFTDPRDGEEYELTCIGNQTWFAENLRYDAPGNEPPDKGRDIAVHGRLYDYNTVSAGQGKWTDGAPPIQGICPTGWHVPNHRDWKTLLDELGTETNENFEPVNPDSRRKTVIRLLGNDPDLSDYEEFKDDPDLNSSGFTGLATGTAHRIVGESDNDLQYYSNINTPLFWSTSSFEQNGDKNDEDWFIILHVNGVSFKGLRNPQQLTQYVATRCLKN